MKKYILNFFILSLISIAFNASAQNCVLPGLYSGNTGQNMTVFFTPDAISALSTSSNSPYIVAFSQMEC